MPGGGLSPDRRRWIACPPGFFLSVKVLGRLFRRLFLERLAAVFADGGLRFFGDLASLAERRAFAANCAALRRIDWVVYAKPPFGGPEQVLAYLGRYTHRVAIANSRLVAMTDGAVSFLWKDYRQQGRRKVMTLEPAEFMRRFLLHVLPSGFHRIRHFGFLANGHRAGRLALADSCWPNPPRVGRASPTPSPTTTAGLRLASMSRRSMFCPCCGRLSLILSTLPRAPAHPAPPADDDRGFHLLRHADGARPCGPRPERRARRSAGTIAGRRPSPSPGDVRPRTHRGFVQSGFHEAPTTVALAANVTPRLTEPSKFSKAGGSDSRCVLGREASNAWRDTCRRICGSG